MQEETLAVHWVSSTLLLPLSQEKPKYLAVHPLETLQIMGRSLALCVEHKYTLFCDVVWSYTVLYQNHREPDVRGTKPEFQVCFVFLCMKGEKNMFFLFVWLCFVFNLL